MKIIDAHIKSKIASERYEANETLIAESDKTENIDVTTETTENKIRGYGENVKENYDNKDNDIITNNQEKKTSSGIDTEASIKVEKDKDSGKNNENEYAKTDQENDINNDRYNISNCRGMYHQMYRRHNEKDSKEYSNKNFKDNESKTHSATHSKVKEAAANDSSDDKFADGDNFKILTGHTGNVHAVAFSKLGMLVSTLNTTDHLKAFTLEIHNSDVSSTLSQQ